MLSKKFDPAKPTLYVNLAEANPKDALLRGTAEVLRVNDLPVRRFRNEVAERLSRTGAEDLGSQLRVLVKICAKYVNLRPAAPPGQYRYENAIRAFRGDWEFVYVYMGAKNGDPTPAFHRIDFLRRMEYPSEIIDMFWAELMRRLDAEEPSDLTYKRLSTQFHLGAAAYVKNRKDLSEVRTLVSH